ncbi:MAG: acyl carrier protein [Candidatus Eisenbacteria sp.]|nr:acyl carrier protein [Candidatus Eisenbacteria bacterium]
MQDSRMKIRDFLGRFFGDYQLRDDEDIFGVGFVNSLFAMQLVLFIEKEFGITVGNEDLSLANFRSIGAMAELIERKRSGG